MEIGGRDFVFTTQEPECTLRRILGVVEEFWPEGVVENALTGELLSWEARRWSALPEELLVYRNQQVRQELLRHGARGSLRRQYLHLLRGDEEVTLVVGDLEDELAQAITESLAEAPLLAGSAYERRD